MNQAIKTIYFDSIKAFAAQHDEACNNLLNLHSNSIKNFSIFKSNCQLSQGVPYKLDHFAISLCVKGSCKNTMGHFSFNVVPGSIHIIHPGMISMFENASADLELYVILFKKQFLNDLYIKEGVLESMLMTGVDIPPIAHLDAEAFERVLALFNQMNLEFTKDDTFQVKIIQTLLMQLFYLCGRALFDYPIEEQIKHSRGFQLTQQFKLMVDKHFNEKRTVQEYAELLNVSAKHLGETVKHETDESALKIIHERIYLEALYLLNYTAMSVKEIADTLNFDTPSHFTRFFKSIAGFTPTSFKNAI